MIHLKFRTHRHETICVSLCVGANVFFFAIAIVIAAERPGPKNSSNAIFTHTHTAMNYVWFIISPSKKPSTFLKLLPISHLRSILKATVN